MASQFQVQKPYVLTTLPRPLDPTTGAYIVGEVYGYAPGLKKRKRRRAELTVGIDGEAVNIYDISSSRLVTSYPIPPQSHLTCPASSFRLKSDTSKDVSRYTYAAADESQINKITLFKDSVGASGKTLQITSSATLGKGQPVVWLGPMSSSDASNEAAEATPNSEILVIRADGGIVCLDGESLQQKWKSSGQAMIQDLPNDSKTDFTIELCCSVSAADVIKGVFKGNSDVFSILSAPSDEVSSEAEVFVMISSSGAKGRRSRHLHIVSRLPSTPTSTRSNEGLVQLHAMPLSTTHEKTGKPGSYRLDVRNGALLELHDQSIIIHDLTASVPKITSSSRLDGTTSFLPLSKTSLLCSTDTQLSVFNPVYKSLQNTTDIDLAAHGHTDTMDDKGSVSCQLVAYFAPLERAISIVGSNLVAIQLEAPKGRHAKRRAEGLLIDSIGRGLPTSSRGSAPSLQPPPTNSIFSNYLPGSMKGDYWEKWTADQKHADSLLEANDVPKFEEFLAQKFDIAVEAAPVPDSGSADASPSSPPLWRLPKSRANYPQVDRRWVLYAISRCFEWNGVLREDSTIPRLICLLPQSNVLNYLVDAGHLTLSNVRAAFHGQLSEKESADSFLAEQLVERLADVDPTLELMAIYLSATSLGALEILLALKRLMKSLELVNSPKKAPPKLLTEGGSAEGEDVTMGEDGVESENIGMELDDLEDEIQKTVSYLNNEDAGIRGRGLSVAFSKLGACPSSSAIKALRATFRPDEIMSLMLVLRVELLGGGWTDRYVEDDSVEDERRFEAPPDNIIKLIADLLGLCIDALGPGGWLFNDPVQSGDDTADFIDSLTHEVSAALVGLNETVHLRNLLVDPLKYWEAAQKTVAKQQDVGHTTNRPIAVQVREPGANALPLGLEDPTQRVAPQKIVGGGEVVQRSAREIGHLYSQNVGSYSLERIVI
ncbi:hypothetical protein F5Y17DRAFT_333537 [Xylariaceae sp. FL0594]|nr:hypothetical protein F5Y17DRAFT_333537 [Xylariaceae sp. FL0594]